MLSYVVESYVTKSCDDNILYFSPHSAIIAVVPLSIPYFCTKSGLSFAFTASTFMCSFTLLYCFARSSVESSSLYSTKYKLMSFGCLLPCLYLLVLM